jgi:26S proteasome regulatory subunit N2
LQATTQESEVARDALQHGACLGIGLVGMSSATQSLCERLRTVLYADSAVVGEAAALAMGLVLLGAGDEAQAMLQDLVGYAHDTDHEKIKRAAGMACALIYYGREDEASAMINLLVRDKDHLLRYGGVFCVGLAYVGTANNQALQRLLHVAVSDVSNDVRRAAVICLGLVMLRVPSKLPGLIALLSESYNPHVRYGACMALGIGCSGMGNPEEALQVLEPLLEDKTDFVKQAAMMASGLLLAQRRPETDARAKRFRELVYKVAQDTKSASTMSRMGAVLAAGLVDAGGRNVALSLLGRRGKPKPPAVAGVVLWTMSWYWYPCLHMISLALSPTVVAGVNAELDLPVDFRLDCAGGEAHRRFGPPEPVEEKKDEVKARIKTAVLSMTGSAKAKEKLQEAKDAEVREIRTAPPKPVSDDDALANPVRVTKQMLQHLHFRPGARYVPACSAAGEVLGCGVVVLRDTTPGLEQKVAKVLPPPMGDVDVNEPEPPLVGCFGYALHSPRVSAL